MSAEKSLMNSTGYNSKEGSPQAATKTSMKRRKTRHMTLLNVLTLKKLSSTGSRQSYHDIIKSRDDANFAAVFKNGIEKCFLFSWVKLARIKTEPNTPWPAVHRSGHAGKSTRMSG